MKTTMQPGSAGAKETRADEIFDQRRHRSADRGGKRRDVKIEMITFDRPNEMAAESLSQGMNGVMTLELMALSPNRTRVVVGFEIRPQNLSARLFVQSLKLAKGTLTTRYKKRVAEHAKTLEERYKAMV